MEQTVQRLLNRYRDLIDREIRRLHARTVSVDRFQQIAIDLQIGRLESDRADVVKALRRIPSLQAKEANDLALLGSSASHR